MNPLGGRLAVAALGMVLLGSAGAPVRPGRRPSEAFGGMREARKLDNLKSGKARL